jgi:transcriptional regulator with XRE-family HTH domain
MGRPAKDINNSLTRLRKQMKWTRAKLAEHCGIPESTLREIEYGRYQLSADQAVKIVLATGVDLEGLLGNETPLRDVSGKELGPQSQVPAWDPKNRERDLRILEVLSLEAEKEGCAMEFSIAFRAWARKASEKFKLFVWFMTNYDMTQTYRLAEKRPHKPIKKSPSKRR